MAIDKGFRGRCNFPATNYAGNGRGAFDGWTRLPAKIIRVTGRQRQAAMRDSFVLDDVAKQIIEQLQEDGRRPYATIGKAVGLSEAAVRQRVQRLLDAGVMQIVAVTDPLQLGFPRQAMIGDPHRRRPRAGRRPVAELDEVDYVVITAGSFDLLVEVVCESDEALLEMPPAAPRGPGRGLHRDLRVSQAAQADLLVGRPLSRRTAAPLDRPTTGTCRCGTPPPPTTGSPATPCPAT